MGSEEQPSKSDCAAALVGMPRIDDTTIDKIKNLVIRIFSILTSSEYQHVTFVLDLVKYHVTW